jgi:hypothetical protein
MDNQVPIVLALGMTQVRRATALEFQPALEPSGEQVFGPQKASALARREKSPAPVFALALALALAFR